jgi:hypothetical protein
LTFRRSFKFRIFPQNSLLIFRTTFRKPPKYNPDDAPEDSSTQYDNDDSSEQSKSGESGVFEAFQALNDDNDVNGDYGGETSGSFIDDSSIKKDDGEDFIL